MIIIGSKDIPYDIIKKISSIDDIKNTQANSTLLFNFDIKILRYTQANNLNSAVKINNIKEIMYSSIFEAKYIIVPNNLLIQAQKIANNYMFDSKILAIIQNDDELEKAILNEIDGVIYKHIIQ
jgi:hypothetical protein